MKYTDKDFRVLVVDDEPQYREVVQMMLEDEGYTAHTAASGEEALKIIKGASYHVVITDLMMGNMDGIELLKKIRGINKETKIILITGYGTIQNAVEAMKFGAHTFFVKSHEPEELMEELEVIKREVFMNKKVQERADRDFLLDSKNPEFKKVIDMAAKVAKSDLNVLILGESGVGKEVMAKYIHKCSRRENGVFVDINCSAFSTNLLESELFGHEKGAFTGAIERRKGCFEASHGGTLFLDEIGEISLNTQVKLLRSIETKRIQRIGSTKNVQVDFRLVSATNRNLKDEIYKGDFREDLFYRLSTVVIEIPPLRERREDLEDLIQLFLNRAKKEMNQEVLNIEEGVMEFLLSYDYPGNIRELKNMIDRLVVLCDNQTIERKDLPQSQMDMGKPYERDFKKVLSIDCMEDIRPLKDIRREIESEYIDNVLQACDRNISEAARRLSISRRQLFNKICEYKLK